MDDLALAIHVKGKGLVVLAGCAHSGIINSVRQCQKVTGVEQVYAIMGGFHLGFPNVPEECMVKTVAELKRMGPAIVSPMHCSGLKTLCAVAREMPGEFLLNTAGARITI